MKDIFISHAHQDHSFVKQEILPILQREGLSVWLDEQDILTAEKWEGSIRRGLEQSLWFLVVVSSQSAKSRWVAREVHWAMEERPEKFIPLLKEACDFSHWHLGLRELQYIDFSTKKTIARKGLVSICARIRKEQADVLQVIDSPFESVGGRPNEGSGVITETGTTSIEIVIDRDFETYSDSEQKRLLQAIRELLGVSDDIRVVRKRKGSVKLTLELSAQDAEKLLWAIKSGDLAELGVIDASMVESSVKVGRYVLDSREGRRAERLLVRRLGNRVRDVRVVILPDGFILKGHTSTYHAKQLAQHIAMEILDLPMLANEIVVL